MTDAHASSRPRDLDARILGRHVRQTPAPRGRAYPGGAPLLVTGTAGRALIDSGLGTPRIPVDVNVLSHYHEDHVVDVGRSTADALIHPHDLAAVTTWEGFQAASGYPEPWRRVVQDQFRWTPILRAAELSLTSPIDLGGVRIHTVPLPGHTPGHCGFLVEPDGVFYLADLDLSTFGPYYGDACSSLVDTVASLETARAMEAAVYVTFHHKGPYRSRAQFHEALAAHRDALDRREAALRRLLDQRPNATAVELTGRGVVYRPGTAPPWGLSGETRMIQLHLEEMAGA